MSLASAGEPYGFNYVAADQQTGLFVAANIFDITTGTPIFVEQVPLVEVDPVKSPGTYSGIFTPVTAKVYDIVSMVYTDPDFTTLDTNRAPGCETIQTVTFSGGSSDSGGGCEILGFIVDNNIVGFIEPVDTVIGYVEC